MSHFSHGVLNVKAECYRLWIKRSGTAVTHVQPDRKHGVDA